MEFYAIFEEVKGSIFYRSIEGLDVQFENGSFREIRIGNTKILKKRMNSNRKTVLKDIYGCVSHVPNICFRVGGLRLGSNSRRGVGGEAAHKT